MRRRNKAAGPEKWRERHMSSVSDMMGERRTLFLVRVLSAAVLAAMALADEPQDNQSMRPVGFDITLQALPSGELGLFLCSA